MNARRAICITNPWSYACAAWIASSTSRYSSFGIPSGLEESIVAVIGFSSTGHLLNDVHVTQNGEYICMISTWHVSVAAEDS